MSPALLLMFDNVVALLAWDWEGREITCNPIFCTIKHQSGTGTLQGICRTFYLAQMSLKGVGQIDEGKVHPKCHWVSEVACLGMPDAWECQQNTGDLLL